MRACPGCGDLVPESSGTCPSCGRSSGGPASPPPTPPPPPPGSGSDPAEGAPAPERGAAEGRIRTLGALYLAAGAWLLLSHLAMAALVLSGVAFELVRDLDLGRDPQVQELLDQALEMLESPFRASIPHIFGVGLGALLLRSGTRLRALRGRGPALAAAVGMIVYTGCLMDCCACCLPIALGVYALFVLNGDAARRVLAD